MEEFKGGLMDFEEFKGVLPPRALNYMDLHGFQWRFLLLRTTGPLAPRQSIFVFVFVCVLGVSA